MGLSSRSDSTDLTRRHRSSKQFVSTAISKQSSTPSPSDEKEPHFNQTADDGPPQHQHSDNFSGSRLIRTGMVIICLYALGIAIFCKSARAQTYLIYLHWLRPPSFFYPLTNLRQHRLGDTARNVVVQHLRGWHVLPPGAPFAPAGAGDAYFDTCLSAPRQRVILFYHGNAGTRAFPPKRVHLVRLLNAQFSAHIVTFDYSGFGDSRGAPCEQTFYADALLMFRWVMQRVDPTTSVFIYGQSLGSFAATHVASRTTNSNDQASSSQISGAEGSSSDEDTLLQGGRLAGVLLDAPPVSLQTAALTHPIMKPFRAIGLTRAFSRLIYEGHDSTRAVTFIRTPLIIMHGSVDTMIPSWQGRLLAERARNAGNSRVRYTEFENVGHVDVSGAEGYLRTVHNFICTAESEFLVGPACLDT